MHFKYYFNALVEFINPASVPIINVVLIRYIYDKYATL